MYNKSVGDLFYTSGVLSVLILVVYSQTDSSKFVEDLFYTLGVPPVLFCFDMGVSHRCSMRFHNGFSLNMSDLPSFVESEVNGYNNEGYCHVFKDMYE